MFVRDEIHCHCLGTQAANRRAKSFLLLPRPPAQAPLSNAEIPPLVATLHSRPPNLAGYACPVRSFSRDEVSKRLRLCGGPRTACVRPESAVGEAIHAVFGAPRYRSCNGWPCFESSRLSVAGKELLQSRLICQRVGSGPFAYRPLDVVSLHRCVTATLHAGRAGIDICSGSALETHTSLQ